MIIQIEKLDESIKIKILEELLESKKIFQYVFLNLVYKILSHI